MRLAGSDELYGAIAGQPGCESNGKLDTFLRTYELLRSKGYSNQAAQVSATEMTAGRQPMPRTTLRFAGINGQPITDAFGSGAAD